jgi:signal transduction histidine kinase
VKSDTNNIERYRVFFEQAPVACFVIDSTGVVRDANICAAALTDTTPESARDKPLAELLQPLDLATFTADLEQLRAGALDQRQWLLQGNRSVRVSGQASGDDEWLLHIHECAATSAAQISDLIVESAPIGLLHVCMSGRIITANKRARDILVGSSSPAGTVLGQFARLQIDLVDEADVPVSIDRLPVGRCLASNVTEGPDVVGIKAADGAIRWVFVVAIPLVDKEGGETMGVLAAMSDLTDHKHAEEDRMRLEMQIAQTSRAESLRRLAGGIAHDFNNLLMGILGNGSLALMDVGDNTDVRKCLVDMMDATSQARDLTNQMLAFAGRGQVSAESLNLTRVIASMGNLLEAAASKKASIHYDCDDNVPLVNADPLQIQRVILNLVSNASEALNELQGVITITTGCMFADAGYLASCYSGGELQPGPFVYMEVTDNGIGIDPAVQKQVFEPFFSTTDSGRGLGLAAAAGVVSSHGGAIRLTSQLGRGSTFTVLLPATESATTERKPAVRSSAATGTLKTGKIIVIEDDAKVRSVTQRILERLGHAVVCAENGTEGLNLLPAHSDAIALILDMSMPDMNGAEVLREIRDIAADIPVLLSSGYNESGITERYGQTPADAFIQKPYGPAELVRKLKSIIK